jgi:hypothetical protein
MHISEIDTPAILIDLDIMERTEARGRLRPRPRPALPAHQDAQDPARRKQVELGAAG